MINASAKYIYTRVHVISKYYRIVYTTCIMRIFSQDVAHVVHFIDFIPEIPAYTIPMNDYTVNLKNATPLTQTRCEK